MNKIAAKTLGWYGIILTSVCHLHSAPGDLKWQFQTGSDRGVSSPAIGADGTVYIGAYSKVFALDGVTGQKKWESATPNIVNSAPAIGADGTVYIGSSAQLYALNGNTGQQKWEFPSVGSVYSSPAIGCDGTVYFGSTTTIDMNFAGWFYAVDGATGAKKMGIPNRQFETFRSSAGRGWHDLYWAP